MTTPARVVAGQMGCFLDPPGSPQYEYEVIEGPTRNPRSITSLNGALKDELTPEHVKAQIRGLFERADIRCTEEWLREVYAYFRRCYSPDGVDRNVSICVIDYSPNGPTRDPNHHLAVMLVRTWFPDHEPRMDLIYGLES
ncbi:MAG TPA: hypothetical protein VK631_22235 [Solirubrobacteraceae bacterium]|nr:hypothetical protein [Solirubrobacteraceae bacterium]